jgi:hypothetical protein
MGISSMRIQKHITLQPNPTYLFSYVWLALELILFTAAIELFFPSNVPLVTTVFILCFGRLYYWLNFSPESGVQSLFILGVIPIFWLVHALDGSTYFLLIVVLYSCVLFFCGLYRVLKTKFHFTNSIVRHQLIRTKTVEIDSSRQIEMYQHSRGKKLNFGCILIPIIDPKNSDENLIFFLLFHQRSKNRFFRSLRIDGIRNPEKALQDIRKLTNEYFD